MAGNLKAARKHPRESLLTAWSPAQPVPRPRGNLCSGFLRPRPEVMVTDAGCKDVTAGPSVSARLIVSCVQLASGRKRKHEGFSFLNCQIFKRKQCSTFVGCVLHVPQRSRTPRGAWAPGQAARCVHLAPPPSSCVPLAKSVPFSKPSFSSATK